MVLQKKCIVCFIDRCLFFCPFTFGHCVSVLLRLTDSEYHFGIFKLFLHLRERLRMLDNQKFPDIINDVCVLQIAYVEMKQFNVQNVTYLPLPMVIISCNKGLTFFVGNPVVRLMVRLIIVRKMADPRYHLINSTGQVAYYINGSQNININSTLWDKVCQ